MTCGDKCKCDCCKKKKERAKKDKATKKLKASAPVAKYRMVNINVTPPVGEGAPRWKKDLVSVDSIGGEVKPVKTFATMGTQTERPRGVSMETQTENILRQEVQAPRPAKYIRQPVTISAREPTMAVVEPPSRYARHFAEMERRQGYREIIPSRTAEMGTEPRAVGRPRYSPETTTTKGGITIYREIE